MPGVCGAALADLGLPVELLRGFALLARAAGLLGQIAEERRSPIGMDAYLAVDRNAVYVEPSEVVSRLVAGAPRTSTTDQVAGAPRTSTTEA